MLVIFANKQFKILLEICFQFLSALVMFSVCQLICCSADFIFFFMEMAFFINLVRELTKDILDLKGDSKMKVKTIPAIYGEARSARFAAILTAVATIIMITHPIFNDQLLSRSYFIGATGTFLVLSMIEVYRRRFLDVQRS